MNHEFLAISPEVVNYFKSGSRIVVLTGAGISADSGVPTFRGKGGVWDRYDPHEVGTAEAMRKRPKKVWEMHEDLRQTIARCRPNPAHQAIAELETIFEHVTIVTQNVDNFHQEAGSSHVLELHGNAWRVKCTKEGTVREDHTMSYPELPPKCSCGAMLRPDVVFFDEPLDRTTIESAYSEASLADILLVVGTSAVVYPAAYIPILAKQTGSKIIEFNIEYTPLSTYADATIIEDACKSLPRLVQSLKTKYQKVR
jgi:NAD-dependent deacetylase